MAIFQISDGLPLAACRSMLELTLMRVDVRVPIALLLLAASLSLTGCGVADTAASAAVGGASEVEQAREAKATEDRVRAQLEQASRAAAEQRQAAEAANP